MMCALFTDLYYTIMYISLICIRKTEKLQFPEFEFENFALLHKVILQW